MPPLPRLDRLAAIVEEYGLANGQDYGGQYLENGRIHVLFTGDRATHARRLDVLCEGEKVSVGGARYSWKELRELQERLDRDADMLRREGIVFSSVGPSSRANRVVVTLSPDSASDADARLSELYTNTPLTIRAERAYVVKLEGNEAQPRG